MREANQKEKELFVCYGSAASEAMLDFPCYFFHIPSCSGMIAYRIECHCAIVFGDPICPIHEVSPLTEAFHAHCRQMCLNIIYLIVSKDFADWANQHCALSIKVCEELIFDPVNDPSLTSSRMRHRIDKAIEHGLTVHEYLPFDAEIEHHLQQVGIQWRKSIKGPHLYLGHLNFFANYVGKRWFYVKQREHITSMLMLSKLDAHQGWLLKFLMTLPDASQHTSELLMTSVLRILKTENCRFLTKGMVPVHKLAEARGLGCLSRWTLNGLYAILSKVFKFQQRQAYWMRYHPKLKPAYLLFYQPHIGIKEIKALMKVLKAEK